MHKLTDFLASVYFGMATPLVLADTLASKAAAFKAPQEVIVHDLPLDKDGDGISTEEPFLSRDGKFLFFNSGESENHKDLHYAKLQDERWVYQAEMGPGVNTPDDVEGNPTLDSAGNFYFVDSKFPHMIRGGTFHSVTGELSDLYEVQEVPKKEVQLFRQQIFGNMGVEVSADGDLLFFDRAAWQLRLIALGQIFASDIYFLERKAGRWAYDEAKAKRIMAAINTDDCEYAESLSTDTLEIFFTRLDPRNIKPGNVRSKIMYSSRNAITEPFPKPVAIPAIGESDFVEAPSISADGQALYYHKLVRQGTFRIFKVSRKAY
ncbi:MAG: hypothetical protein KDD69_05045 [Bdellovibrionales bacterium]|nr:hypothetical protein [Bdellovibrionales bacterium]